MQNEDNEDAFREELLRRLELMIEWTYVTEEVGNLIAQRDASLSEEALAALDAKIDEGFKKIAEHDAIHNTWYPDEPLEVPPSEPNAEKPSP